MDMYYCIIDNYIVQQVGCMWQQLYQSCDRCKMVSYDRSIVALSTVVPVDYSSIPRKSACYLQSNGRRPAEVWIAVIS